MVFRPLVQPLVETLASLMHQPGGDSGFTPTPPSADYRIAYDLQDPDKTFLPYFIGYQ